MSPFTPTQTQANGKTTSGRLNSIWGIIVRDAALTTRLQSLADEVYLGFKQRYPRLMANKAKVSVVVVENNDPRTLQAFRGRLIAPHGLLVASTGFVRSGLSRPAKLGFVAHEIAHLYLGHPRVSQKIIRLTYADGQSLRPAEDEAAHLWLALKSFVGWIHVEEANGLAMGPEGSLAFKNFKQMLRTHTERAACVEYSRKAPGLGKTLTRKYSIARGDFTFVGSADLQELNATTRQILALMSACVATLPKELNALELTFEEFSALASAALIKRQTRGPPRLTLAEYVTMNKKAAAKLRELERHFDRSRLRTYTIEDQTETLALSVLLQLGLSPIPYINEFFNEVANELDCVQLVQADAEPPFGNLIDPHHGMAWRYFNLKQQARNPRLRLDGLE